MTALIESAGGVIVLSDFGTNKLMGMSCWERGNQPLFFLNSRMSTAGSWLMRLGGAGLHAVHTDRLRLAAQHDVADEFEAVRGACEPVLDRIGD